MPKPEDALLDAQVERAMAPYRDMLPPEALAEMRDALSDFLATHPAALRLMARLRPPPAVQFSGPVEHHDNDAEREPASVQKSGTGGVP